MLSRFMRLLILCLLMLSLASPGFAARRSSTGGNLLIKDTDDIFFYPQRIGEYNRLVTFDLGSSSSSGSGGIIFGNESLVFGAFSHRSAFFGATQNAFQTIGDTASGGGTGSTNIVDPPLIDPMQWFDFMFGWQGGENPWGARVSVGRNQDDAVGSDETVDVTGVNIVVGFTINDIDLSGEFGLASAEHDNGAATPTITKDSPLGFAVSARKTATDESDDLQLGWLGMFGYTTGGPEETGGATSKVDESQIMFEVGAGPVYTPHERTSVAMYGTLGYDRDKAESSGSTFTMTNYVVPGWNIAAEVEVASWLQARAGVRSRFRIVTDKTEASGSASVEDQGTSLEFSWHTGIGISFDDFTIDGYFDPNVITSGTDLLGSNSDLFGLVTASYAF